MHSQLSHCDGADDAARQQLLMDRWASWGKPSIRALLDDAHDGAYDKLLQMNDGKLGWLAERLQQTGQSTSAAGGSAGDRLQQALLNADQVVIELERELRTMKANDRLSPDEKASQLIDNETFKKYFSLTTNYSAPFTKALVAGICDMAFMQSWFGLLQMPDGVCTTFLYGES